ncbi:MAG: hypothetical protein H0W94_06235 [Actinobacteria bacterium]|nr:hypothetical protein [Actinomycetota bacterium]
MRRTNGSRRPVRKRVLIYSHDTYGLGHLRRCLSIAATLSSSPAAPSILIATGSPRTQAFEFPPGCDSIKLPAVTKTREGKYLPRTLRLPLADVVAVRAEMLRAAARSFRPDLVLVDHAPLGMQGELRPLFEEVARWPRKPRVVLGLREVIDEADRVREEWDRAGAWTALERIYDRVLVYGDPHVLTTADELGLASRFPGKVSFVGYLGRPIPRPLSRPGEPRIVVTAGGGGDGQDVLRAYAAFLESLDRPAPFRSVVVTGPFVSSRRRQEISERYAALRHPVDLLTFTDRMEEMIGSARGVVSMAGYNTVVEILSAGVPALLVPRQRPRLEQAIRAARLAGLGGVEACTADACTPERLARFVGRAMAEAPKPARVSLEGLERTAEELLHLLDRPKEPIWGSREDHRVAIG